MESAASVAAFCQVLQKNPASIADPDQSLSLKTANRKHDTFYDI
jgi:hypothetical protein